MSADQPNSGEANGDSPWEAMPADRPKPPEPRASGASRAMLFLFGAVLLLLMGGGAWFGWRALRTEHPNPAANQELAADENCEKVTRLLRDLPNTKEGIEALTAQINEETARLEGRAEAVKRDEREWARLGLVYSDLKKARTGLAAKLEPFTKRTAIKGSTPASGESTSIKDLERAAKGVEVTSGPGPDLLAAVDRYDAACRKLLALRQHQGEEGATWGK